MKNKAPVKFFFIFFLAALLLILMGCKREQEEEYQYIYAAPTQKDDGWAVANIGDEGLSLTTLTRMMEVIHSNNYGFLKSILVVRNNNLIFEEYFGAVNWNSRAHVQSVTKSFTSAIFGIAMDQDLIGTVNDRMFDFFPEYDFLKTTDKQKILLSHILTMTCGLEWNEVSTGTVYDSENDNMIANNSGNYIHYVLSKPLVSEPGSQWYYHSGCPILLGGIIFNKTGMHADEFSRINLFEPLGISGYNWTYQSDGLPWTHGGLWIIPREMAKFGQLFLNKGVWQGRRIISEDWVRESTRNHVRVSQTVGYGYQWWTRDIAGVHMFYADGYGGQHIMIIEEYNMVIITTASYSDTAGMAQQRRNIWGLVESHLIPAVVR